MTDVEISKALALAIGWKRMLPNPEADGLKQCWVWTGQEWRLFDHNDWNVIGPIAERYDCFPKKANFGGWVNNLCVYTTTPQRAIALAVIGVEK